MQVEDSYEGAVLRLQRLEQAALVQPPENAERMRELEELASIACEENERLQRELTEARDQIASLQRLVAMLEESAAQPQHPIVQEPIAQDLTIAKKRAVWPFLLVGVAVLVTAGAFAFQPSPHVAAAAVALPPPAPPPPPPVVHVAPPVAPPVAPVVTPKVAPAPRVIAKHKAKPEKKSVITKKHDLKSNGTDPLDGLNL